jgi:hypothetical protein
MALAGFFRRMWLTRLLDRSVQPKLPVESYPATPWESINRGRDACHADIN